MSFAIRLQDIMGDIPILTFAKKCGVPQNSIRQYLSGSVPGIDKAVAIADANGVSLEWLITGKGLKTGSFVSISVLPTLGSLNRGPALEYSEIGDAFPLPSVWADRWKIKENTHRVVWGVEGMEPTIDPHDKLICRMANDLMAGDGIYLIRQADVYTVKRLQWLPDKIRVKSDNQRFEDYDLPLDTDAIAGRVILKIDFKRI